MRTVADGMKVTLFASEEDFPELVNPVQMAFDTKGRLWVAAWRTYPHWKPTEPMSEMATPAAPACPEPLKKVSLSSRPVRSPLSAASEGSPTSKELAARWGPLLYSSLKSGVR